MTAPTLHAPSAVAPPPTGSPDSRIDEIRVEITGVDEQILALVARRSALSREVGALRMAAGGTRLSLARERAIVDQFFFYI